MFKVSQKSNGRIRFNVFGKQGFIALRTKKSRGWNIQSQNTFTQYHMGKVSIAIEKKQPSRKLHHFAG